MQGPPLFPFLKLGGAFARGVYFYRGCFCYSSIFFLIICRSPTVLQLSKSFVSRPMSSNGDAGLSIQGVYLLVNLVAQLSIVDCIAVHINSPSVLNTPATLRAWKPC